MRFFRVIPTLALALAIAATAAAQSRGTLRISGKVLDEAGKPVAGAQVRAAKKGETEPQVFSATTNDKGEYSINGVAPGEWVLEAQKEGVGVAEAMATLTPDQRTTTLDFTIAKPAPKVDPSVEITEGDKQAIELARADKFAEARKIYEDLLAKYPAVHGLHVRIATMYAEEKNPAKGLEHMRIALEKDPANVDFQLLEAELMMDAGDKAGAQKALETIDMTKVKDPRAFTNMAINHINDGRHAEAIDLLTKLMAQFPDEKALLYYRGRAYIVATKLPEAKADLEAFVAAAPTAPQAADAKKLLEQLTKK